MKRLCLFIISLAACPQLFAHTFSFTDTTLKIDGNRFQVTMICDLDALALGLPPQEANSAELAEHLKGLEQAALTEKRDGLINWLTRRIRVRFDDQPQPFTVTLPDEGKPTEADAEPTYFGIRVILDGQVPEGAAAVSFFASRTFPALRLTLEGPHGPVGDPMALPGGQRSAAVPLEDLKPPGGLAVARQYLLLGFYHILPLGLDHILFVLGLFLFCRTIGPLLWQVTAFTAAHTLTLALAASGVVSLPSRPVEVLIAASIVYVAAENFWGEKLRAHRIVVVFGFGLLHGLGFAGVLGELGLPSHAFTTALLAFNIGVELGQLAVILIAFLLVGWWRNKPFYRNRIVRPISLLIGLTGLFWVVERLL
ncbi:MAG: HupE/UreJ family protein [Acidobacteriota bacterium]|nr:HupE/UreJ family protein [Acidobacteriota bacterium]